MMKFFKDKKRWLLILLAWLVAALALSLFATGAKEQTSPNKNEGLPETAASIQAEKSLQKYFPSSEGVPLFVVVYDKDGLKDADVEQAMTSIEKVMGNADQDLTVVPLSKLPTQARASFFSKDHTTFFLPVLFPNGLENKVVKATIDGLKKDVSKEVPAHLDTYFTGPAGIIADTYEMFTKADVVLILATVGLIFLLLIVIYRSPLLAFIPLIGAGISYMVVDRLLGFMGELKWFAIDSQSLSIMTILLFAVITDYSLLLFARFREELEKDVPVNEAMKTAVRVVKEPIFFSGGTIFLSMLTLFFAVYEPYRGFAPVFAVAVALMILAGLTLLPALFAIAGEKAFWPANPRAVKRAGREGFWHKMGRWVTNKPWVFMAPILVVLVFCASLTRQVHFSFNLLDSFPQEMSSIKGFNRLNDAFSAGEIAPSTVIVKAKGAVSQDQIQRLVEELNQKDFVSKADVQGNPYAEGNPNVVKVNLVLKNNPYSEQAFDDIESLREDSANLLKSSGLAAADAKLLVAGESAQNADIREASHGDEIRIITMMTVLIMVMLGIQTRSILAPVYMMGTILLSYGAALGLSIFVFQELLGYPGVSYRIPLYTFVFLVALGVDYSIMLISRIREEKKHLPLKDAVREGVGKTGGVISSAGLILAATFAVLITQPVLELRVFGFAVAVGVLIDTFIVRPIVIPALMVVTTRVGTVPQRFSAPGD
ncbi:RND superfamily putative drug exporter [Bacillus sp. SORGH_AS 510]|uniref:MMPL family transporter n=1 Tax=Bacillus sp. SORGH_AS_0510 TaxID=3041771 RepID=UPI00277E06F0|nr:MMPL family transporter [Bacillus sp. SORGH_AS_0510]MDQ1144131.1 RND superfamily putative drug exporter [Bacillus sp. SORGH_AS_0510]